LTIHRESVSLIKFLPGIKVFISFDTQTNFKIWRLHKKERKAQILVDFRINKVIKNIIILTTKEVSHIERFLIIFTTGQSEIFEFNIKDDTFHYIESEKFREHECELSGFDYNVNLGLIVTADVRGFIRIWNRDKKFIREI
jgi:WD40 repeat protein